MATIEQYIGQPLLRKEDAKLLAGEGSFIDNQSMAGMVWIALVRPPYVHATIEGVDTAAAAAMPGVVAVYTGADLQGEWAAGLPMVWPNTEDIKIPTHYPLTADKIRFAGDAVAVVVAQTREQAEDAVEAVSVRATALPAVLDLEEAATDGVVIHEDLGTNNVVHWIHGGAGDQSVFDTAPVIIQERYTQPRLIPNAMEARGCLAYGSAAAGEFTLASATQIPHIARVGLSITTGIAAEQAADHRAGRGRRLRIEARRLRRGGARARAVPQAQPSGEVDRDAFGELRGDDPRPRSAPRLHARRDGGRSHPRDEVRRARGHGRLLPAADARGSPSSVGGCTWAPSISAPIGTSTRAS